MEKRCSEKPPWGLVEGIEQFNRGEYYQCHETLEEIWRADRSRIRDLYKGILQIGVAIYHAQRSNLSGAERLLASGMKLLRPFGPQCMGIDVADLLESAERFREELKELGAADSGTALGAIPHVRFVK